MFDEILAKIAEWKKRAVLKTASNLYEFIDLTVKSNLARFNEMLLEGENT